MSAHRFIAPKFGPTSISPNSAPSASPVDRNMRSNAAITRNARASLLRHRGHWLDNSSSISDSVKSPAINAIRSATICGVHLPQIASAFNQRPHRRVHRRSARGRPKSIDPVILQKHAGQVRLGVQISRNDAMPAKREHPSQVVQQRSFSDASLVVEESHCLHGRFLTVTCTQPGASAGSKRNSGAGLPLAASDLRAISIP